MRSIVAALALLALLGWTRTEWEPEAGPTSQAVASFVWVDEGDVTSCADACRAPRVFSGPSFIEPDCD